MGITDKNGYPSLPVNHWWALRKKFQSSVPKTITTSYIATALNMQESSARTNILPALMQFGMIDESSKPTQIVFDWREDSHYPGVCRELLEKIYPADLYEAIDPKNPDRSAVVAWFKRTLGAGDGYAGKLTQIFLLLLKGDPSEQSESKKKPQTSNNGAVKTVIQKPKVVQKQTPQIINPPVPQIQNFSPAVHIDLQIHIAPETSAEQINIIFESIAKHLFKQGNADG
jgi:hypothetical protein